MLTATAQAHPNIAFIKYWGIMIIHYVFQKQINLNKATYALYAYNGKISAITAFKEGMTLM